MLVIDELHNLLSGWRTRQLRLHNLLRWLGNELQFRWWVLAQPRHCARFEAMTTLSIEVRTHRSAAMDRGRGISASSGDVVAAAQALRTDRACSGRKDSCVVRRRAGRDRRSRDVCRRDHGVVRHGGNLSARDRDIRIYATLRSTTCGDLNSIVQRSTGAPRQWRDRCQLRRPATDETLVVVVLSTCRDARHAASDLHNKLRDRWPPPHGVVAPSTRRSAHHDW